MIDLLFLHFMQTWQSNGVRSQMLFVPAGLVVTLAVWRRVVRRITRLLSTTAVLALSTVMFCHPVDLSHVQPPGPPTMQLGHNQP